MRGTVADAQRISLEKRAAIEAAKQDKINQERNKLISEITNLKLLLSQKDLDINKKSEIINNLQKNVIALKDNTISQLSQKIAEQNNIIITKDNQINSLNVQITNVNSTIVNKDNEINKLSGQLTVKNNEITAFKASLEDKNKEINKLSTQLNINNNEITTFKANLADKDKEISNLSSDNDKLTKAVKQKDNSIFELTNKLEVITNSISSYEDQLLHQLEDEFVRIDINEQDDLTLLGDN